jgi:putative DNA primase/helicase
MADPANPLLDAARAWHDAGFCVIPSHEDGGKRPFGQWKKYQTQRPTWDELATWLNSGRYTGIGLIMGQASGNAEMIELEGPSDDMYLRLNKVVAEANKNAEINLDTILTQVLLGFSETSGGGGLHTIIRVTDGPAKPNLKLAHDGTKVVAETRGEGGFVIVYPTPARIGHTAGSAYVLERGGPDTVANLTCEERDMLHDIFTYALDAPQTPTPITDITPKTQHASPYQNDGLSPLDDYANQVTWEEILQTAGWTHSHSDGKRDHWTRPGKNKADGASGNILDGCLYVHSTSVTDLPTNTGLSKAQVYAHLNHQGDLSAATRALRASGYGEPYTSPAPLAEFHAINQQPADDNNPTYSDLTWVITGQRREPPAPTWLPTRRGDRLFYTARVNGLFGDPETAKSWIAMCAVTEALHENER